MVVKRVGAVSCAKIAGTLYAVMGILVGALISLAAMAGLFANTGPNGAPLPMKFAAAAVVVLPILYGCMGFVATFIAASLYNVLAGILGGIEIDIE
jgi:hypothetical protein